MTTSFLPFPSDPRPPFLKRYTSPPSDPNTLHHRRLRKQSTPSLITKPMSPLTTRADETQQGVFERERPKSGILPFLKRRSKPTSSPLSSPTGRSFLSFDTHSPSRTTTISRQSTSLGPGSMNPPSPPPVPSHRGHYPSTTGIMISHMGFGDGSSSSAPATLRKSPKKASRTEERGSLDLPMMEMERFRVEEEEEWEGSEEEVNMDEWVVPGITTLTPPSQSDSRFPTPPPPPTHPHSTADDPALTPRTAQIELEALSILSSISTHLNPEQNPNSPHASLNSPLTDNASIRSWREARKRSLQVSSPRTHSHTHTSGPVSYRPAPLPPPLGKIPPTPTGRREGLGEEGGYNKAYDDDDDAGEEHRYGPAISRTSRSSAKASHSGSSKRMAAYGGYQGIIIERAHYELEGDSRVLPIVLMGSEESDQFEGADEGCNMGYGDMRDIPIHQRPLPPLPSPSALRFARQSSDAFKELDAPPTPAKDPYNRPTLYTPPPPHRRTESVRSVVTPLGSARPVHEERPNYIRRTTLPSPAQVSSTHLPLSLPLTPNTTLPHILTRDTASPTPSSAPTPISPTHTSLGHKLHLSPIHLLPSTNLLRIKSKFKPLPPPSLSPTPPAPPSPLQTRPKLEAREEPPARRPPSASSDLERANSRKYGLTALSFLALDDPTHSRPSTQVLRTGIIPRTPGRSIHHLPSNLSLVPNPSEGEDIVRSGNEGKGGTQYAGLGMGISGGNEGGSVERERERERGRSMGPVPPRRDGSRFKAHQERIYQKEKESATRIVIVEGMRERERGREDLDLKAFLTPQRVGRRFEGEGEGGVDVEGERRGGGRDTVLESEENFICTPSGVRVSVPVDGRRLGWDHPFVHLFEGDARVWVLDKPGVKRGGGLGMGGWEDVGVEKGRFGGRKGEKEGIGMSLIHGKESFRRFVDGTSGMFGSDKDERREAMLW